MERPVIRIAALIDAVEPARRGRFVSACQAVSIGDGNVHPNVFEYRMAESPVSLATLLADDDIRESRCAAGRVPRPGAAARGAGTAAANSRAGGAAHGRQRADPRRCDHAAGPRAGPPGLVCAAGVPR